MTKRQSYSRRYCGENSSLDCCLLDGLVRDVIQGDVPLSKKFSIYVLRTLFLLSDDEAGDGLTDGSQDRGIDAVVIDDSNRIVHLFQFKYHESEDRQSKNFPGRSVDNVISFVDDLLQRRDELIKSSNKLLQAKIHQIWDLLQSGPAQIYIHLASNGRKLEAANRARLESAISKYRGIVREYTASDLVERKVSKKVVADTRRMEFHDGSWFESRINGKRILVGVVTLPELTRFLRHPVFDTQLDHTLFVDNVRGVLGVDAGVNREIARTIASHNSLDFAFFNNGLTIVVDQMLYQAGGNFPVILKNPQIVNGCQTASVVFESLRLSNAHLGSAEHHPSVQVRIIESSDPDFTQHVALTTNSQTRIYGRDLRAIDETQLKIEMMLARCGFTYIRKRSDKSNRPRSQTVDMAKLGQIILSYYKRLPEQAKTKSSDIFGELYDDVFDVNFLNSGRILAVHILSNLVEERRDLARFRLRSADRKRYQEEWIIEGHFHVLAVLGAICERDGIDLSDINGATLRLSEAIAIVAEFVDRHPQVAAYRLFRTVGTAEQLQKLVDKTKKSEIGRPQLDLFGDGTT